MSYQSREIEQAKFTYSPLGKSLEKQIKIIGNQRKKIQASKFVKLEEQDETAIEEIFSKKIKR